MYKTNIRAPRSVGLTLPKIHCRRSGSPQKWARSESSSTSTSRATVKSSSRTTTESTVCRTVTGLIREQTLDELRQYSFNCGKSEFGRVEIPTLEDVYRLLEPTGLYVNVEIKASGTDFVHMVHDCTRDCGMIERVIYSSFNHWNLTDMLAYDKDAFVAPLYGSELVSRPTTQNRSARWLYTRTTRRYSRTPISSRARMSSACAVHPWTVDDPDAIKRLCELDVGAIITNKPDVALEIAQG